MKTMIATKCKDGWHVVTTTIREFRTLDDVLKHARRKGLTVRKELSDKERIYAEEK